MEVLKQNFRKYEVLRKLQKLGDSEGKSDEN